MGIRMPPINAKMFAPTGGELNPTEIRVLKCVMVYYSNIIISIDKCSLLNLSITLLLKQTN